jgi:hypothetical protein
MASGLSPFLLMLRLAELVKAAFASLIGPALLHSSRIHLFHHSIDGGSLHFLLFSYHHGCCDCLHHADVLCIVLQSH